MCLLITVSTGNCLKYRNCQHSPKGANAVSTMADGKMSGNSALDNLKNPHSLMTLSILYPYKSLAFLKLCTQRLNHAEEPPNVWLVQHPKLRDVVVNQEHLLKCLHHASLLIHEPSLKLIQEYPSQHLTSATSSSSLAAGACAKAGRL